MQGGFTKQSANSGALRGKVALISGGASGIGRATALLFAREGASVGIADTNRASGQAVADEINASGTRSIFEYCDVARADDCRCAVDRTVREFGSLHVLFNNAGIVRRGTVEDLAEEDWTHVMDVNVKSMFLLSRFAIPAMAKSGGGSIIHMGSGWGLAAGPRAAVYCASKGAVVQLTRAMAIDHGPQNIRVNCLCPGDTDTPLLRDEARQLGETSAQFLADAANRPLRRIGTPEEIARAALYLAQDASSFVTGTMLVIDGGGLA
ncbi:MAG: SDR family NAD(P)-dependent oxidoreductase [Candidatus Acidiferrales bacterium]